jgi:CRP/FNR family transcriptional regulator, cyclic AMP receptor protein
MQSLDGVLSNGTWPTQPAGRIPLLEVDPDLAGGRSRADGAGRVVVPVLRFPVGSLPTAPEQQRESLGFMVLKGLLICESAVCGRAVAELVGPGDVISCDAQYASGTLPVRVMWTALAPTLLADLSDVDVPAVVTALAKRSCERADRIAVERSIGSHVRVDVRVLAYLWHLADRFGVVAPEGVKLDLPLTHAVLARLVGARRPTVTTALQRLIQLGYLTRNGRTYMLLGDAGSVDDLDRRSPARDFAYPDGDRAPYVFNGASHDGASLDGAAPAVA